MADLIFASSTDPVKCKTQERLWFRSCCFVQCAYSTVTVPSGPMVTVMPSWT